MEDVVEKLIAHPDWNMSQTLQSLLRDYVNTNKKTMWEKPAVLRHETFVQNCHDYLANDAVTDSSKIMGCFKRLDIYLAKRSQSPRDAMDEKFLDIWREFFKFFQPWLPSCEGFTTLQAVFAPLENKHQFEAYQETVKKFLQTESGWYKLLETLYIPNISSHILTILKNVNLSNKDIVNDVFAKWIIPEDAVAGLAQASQLYLYNNIEFDECGCTAALGLLKRLPMSTNPQLNSMSICMLYVMWYGTPKLQQLAVDIFVRLPLHTIDWPYVRKFCSFNSPTKQLSHIIALIISNIPSGKMTWEQIFSNLLNHVIANNNKFIFFRIDMNNLIESQQIPLKYVDKTKAALMDELCEPRRHLFYSARQALAKLNFSEKELRNHVNEALADLSDIKNRRKAILRLGGIPIPEDMKENVITQLSAYLSGDENNDVLYAFKYIFRDMVISTEFSQLLQIGFLSDKYCPIATCHIWAVAIIPPTEMDNIITAMSQYIFKKQDKNLNFFQSALLTLANLTRQCKIPQLTAIMDIFVQYVNRKEHLELLSEAVTKMKMPETEWTRLIDALLICAKGAKIASYAYKLLLVIPCSDEQKKKIFTHALTEVTALKDKKRFWNKEIKALLKILSCYRIDDCDAEVAEKVYDYLYSSDVPLVAADVLKGLVLEPMDAKKLMTDVLTVVSCTHSKNTVAALDVLQTFANRQDTSFLAVALIAKAAKQHPKDPYLQLLAQACQHTDIYRVQVHQQAPFNAMLASLNTILPIPAIKDIGEYLPTPQRRQLRR